MKIRNWFIPNRGNHFNPLALRPLGLIIFTALFVCIPFTYNITSASQVQILGYATNISASGLNNASNTERTNLGLKPLALNTKLTSAATAKASDMFANNYWAHVSPTGVEPWAFINNSGYVYTVAGENLAKGFSESSAVIAAWMASPLHKANIVNTAYEDAGYAVVNGTLLGKETTLVVAMYGAQSTPAAVPAPEPAPAAPVAPESTVAPTANPAPTATPKVEPIVTQTPADTPIKATPEPAIKTANQNVTTDKNVVISPSSPLDILTNSRPIQAYNSFNWGQKASLLLASTMSLLFILKHTMIWRERRRGLRHIWLRSHPLGQAAMLISVVTVTLLSGVGAVL